MKKAGTMFIKNLRYLCLVGVIALGLMTIIGTGGGGGGGAPPAPTNCSDASGTWSIDEVITRNNCPEPKPDEFGNEYTVTQKGCILIVTDDDGERFDGTINGNTIKWSGSYNENEGRVTANISLTLSGDNLNGTASWSWTDGDIFCNGDTKISGTRTGGGTGGTGVSLADLAGTWYGVQEDDVGGWHTISLTVNSTGTITQILVDGANTNVTATLTKLDDQIFGYVESDGTKGGFFVDASARYAGFVDEDFYVVVVQKGATNLPTYAMIDMVGTWSGYGLALDSNLDIATTWTSNAAVLGTFSFSGSNSLGVNFNGSFTGFDDTYGVYGGTFTNSQGGDGWIRGFLSPDKLFAASYSVDTSGAGSFPEDVSFEFWNKQ